MTKKESELTWKDIDIGAIVTEPGNARQYCTGDWRSQRPTYEFSKCIKCGICQLFCPEGCINRRRTRPPSFFPLRTRSLLPPALQLLFLLYDDYPGSKQNQRVLKASLSGSRAFEGYFRCTRLRARYQGNPFGGRFAFLHGEKTIRGTHCQYKAYS